MTSADEPKPADLRTRIRNFISDELLYGSQPQLTESTNILSLLDSQALMQLVTFMEDDLDIQVGEQDIAPENFRTIADIERFAREKAQKS